MLPSIRTVNLARSRFRVKYARLRRQQVMVYSYWRRQRLLNLRRTVQTEDNIDHQPGTRLACFIAPFTHRILNFTLKHIGWLRGQNLYIFHSPSRGHIKLNLYAAFNNVTPVLAPDTAAGYGSEREVQWVRSPPACWSPRRCCLLAAPGRYFQTVRQDEARLV